MDMVEVLAAVGIALLGLLGYIVLDVLGQIAVGEAAEAVARRPSFAERRHRNRILMRTGALTLALAAPTGLIWLAAATSGYESDAQDARILGIVTVVLALAGSGLLASWWRRSGR